VIVKKNLSSLYTKLVQNTPIIQTYNSKTKNWEKLVLHIDQMSVLMKSSDSRSKHCRWLWKSNETSGSACWPVDCVRQTLGLFSSGHLAVILIAVASGFTAGSAAVVSGELAECLCLWMADLETRRRESGTWTRMGRVVLDSWSCVTAYRRVEPRSPATRMSRLSTGMWAVFCVRTTTTATPVYCCCCGYYHYYYYYYY